MWTTELLLTQGCLDNDCCFQFWVNLPFNAWAKQICNDTDKQDLTIHVDLYRQTFTGVYVSHCWVPHSLAVIVPTLFNMGSPQQEVLPLLWELLRPPEPQVIPGGPDIRNAAFQPNTLPREDPRIPRHDLHRSFDWVHGRGYGDTQIQVYKGRYILINCILAKIQILLLQIEMLFSNIRIMLCQAVSYLEFAYKKIWYIPTGTTSSGSIERTEKEKIYNHVLNIM